MKEMYDFISAVNIMGCVFGMMLLIRFYSDIEFKDNERLWVSMGLTCFAFCFLGIVREVYSLTVPRNVAAWPMKFVNAAPYIITVGFYYLVKYFKKKNR